MAKTNLSYFETLNDHLNFTAWTSGMFVLVHMNCETRSYTAFDQFVHNVYRANICTTDCKNLWLLLDAWQPWRERRWRRRQQWPTEHCRLWGKTIYGPNLAMRWCFEVTEEQNARKLRSRKWCMVCRNDCTCSMAMHMHIEWKADNSQRSASAGHAIPCNASLTVCIMHAFEIQSIWCELQNWHTHTHTAHQLFGWSL